MLPQSCRSENKEYLEYVWFNINGLLYIKNGILLWNFKVQFVHKKLAWWWKKYWKSKKASKTLVVAKWSDREEKSKRIMTSSQKINTATHHKNCVVAVSSIIFDLI